MDTLHAIVAFAEAFFRETPSTRRAVAAALGGQQDLHRDFSETQIARALAALTSWYHTEALGCYRGEIVAASLRLEQARKRATRRPASQIPGPLVPPTEGH
jgi:hypothetical protein